MRGNVALVTGAAGGIGAEIVAELGNRGALVAAVDRDKDRLDELVVRCTRRGAVVRPYAADVTDTAEVEDAVAAVERDLGELDFLVNSAGVLHLGEVSTFADEDWRSLFSVNATGVFKVSRAVVTRMRERRHGAIVTVASNAANTPRAGWAAYAASKAAASMFTKSLGLEMAQFGIRCNLVAPGSTETPMLLASWNERHGRERTLKGRPDAFRLGIPLGKTATPHDVAAAVVFLLSDDASHITLHELTVDGGATLGA